MENYSYKTDSNGNFINFKGSDIGLCVWVIYHKLWGKIQVDGKLHSQKWWRFRLTNIIKTDI